MHGSILFFLIVYPFLAGLAALLVPVRAFRTGLVVVSAALVSVCSVLLALSGSFQAAPQTLLGVNLDWLIAAADFILLFVILGIGLRNRHPLIIGVAGLQLVLLAGIEFFLVTEHGGFPAFHNDSLSSTLSLVVALVGSVICLYALPYMKAHEAHMAQHGQTTAGEPRFFAVLLLFFGAMHGLVLANNILHLYFFFEVTTLCSFLLIGHDQTPIARKNSLIALWMNSLGGVALLLGTWVLYSGLGTLEIQAFISQAPAVSFGVFGIAFLALGGMVKAAQLPFQRWLLGAMVAPTPVSALLHSSTMVKAGVYICLRFAPAYADSFVGYGIALCGGFTFLVTAVLALSQSNGKKVLAYSTISNLGLIIACAGLNTPTAIAVGMLLVIFHAVSKALLFLCVGTVEQEIGSRDIEDMRGLYTRMPRTVLVACLGALTMILPPFGMLFGKWLAIEAAAANFLVLVMFAVGSAFTVMYWTRWIGTMLGGAPHDLTASPERETQPFLTRGALLSLCVAALLLPLITPWLYNGVGASVLGQYQALWPEGGAELLAGAAGWVPPLFLLAVLGGLIAWGGLRKARSASYSAPYMSGVNLPEAGTFRGPMRGVVQLGSSNYYLDKIFGEARLTFKVNVAAGLLLLLMLGGGL